MRATILIILNLVAMASLAFADEKLPVLKVGSNTYSNVNVFKVSATDIYFTSDKGIGNAKLKNLEPALQKHFNYNPTNAATVEQKQAEANSQYHTALVKEGASRPPEGARPTLATTSQGVDVYLIPLDDFDLELTVSIAKSLSNEMGIRIKPTGKTTITGLTPFAGTTQFSGDDILDAAKQVAQKLPENHANTAYVVLTQRDINMNERTFRFNFSINHYDTRMSIVSSARLVGPKNGKAADEETIHARIKKMVKRSIGLVYYGYSRSSDVNDLLYTPIMGLNDVDRTGNDFLHPITEQKQAEINIPNQISARIQQEARKCVKAQLNDDYEGIIAYTPKRIVDLVGKEAMIAASKRNKEEFRSRGISLEDITVGEPDKPQKVAGRLVAAIPLHNLMLMKSSGKRIDQETHWLGISEDDGKTWAFIDVSVVTKAQLGQIFPELAERIEIPAQMPPVIMKNE